MPRWVSQGAGGGCPAAVGHRRVTTVPNPCGTEPHDAIVSPSPRGAEMGSQRCPELVAPARDRGQQEPGTSQPCPPGQEEAIYLLAVVFYLFTGGIFSLAVPRTGVAPQLRKRGQEQAPGEGGRTRNPPGRDGSTGRRLRLPRTPHGDGAGGVLVEAAASGGHGGSLGTRCWWHTHRVRSHSLTLAHTQLLLRVPSATSPRKPPALATQPLGQPAGSSRTGGQGQPQAAPPKPLPPRCCLISAPSASAQPGTG